MDLPSKSPVTIRPEVLTVPAYRQGATPKKRGFKLSSNENPFETLPAVQQAVAEAAISRYASVAMPELRTAIGADLGLDEAASQTSVHLGAGSVSILYQLVQMTSGPGDEMIFAWPSFEGYPLLGIASGAKAVRVPLTDRSEHDLEAMADAVTERTRVILLCTPNNPTGTAIRRSDFDRFMERVPQNVLVVLDEAYREFVTNDDAVRGEEVLAQHDNLVVLRTFSKAYGLASLRIGYGVGHPEIWESARVVGIPLSITAQAEAAALASLGGDVQAELRERIDELASRRDLLAAQLRAQGYSVPDAQGNFVWLELGEAAQPLADLFAEEGTLVRPFAGEGVRISVGEAESIDEVLRITAAFARDRDRDGGGRA